MATTSIYMAAQEYARRGIAVFPVKKATKTPVTPHGVKDATTYAHRIKYWLPRFQYHGGVAIACGGALRLLVVDVDVKNNPDAESLLPEIPNTTIVKTPSGGKHIYFRLPEHVNAKNAVSLLPGIDIRWEGGYVVAPPTEGYSFIQNSLFDVNDISNAVAVAPQWLIDLIQSKLISQQKEPKTTPNISPTTGPLVIPEGMRNQTLAKIAGANRRYGISEECLRDILLVVNQHHCQPPLDPTEIARIASSIGKYPAEPIVTPLSAPKPRMDIRAYQGLAGQFIAEKIGNTDAPIEAILMSFLTAVGNIIGRKAYIYVNEVYHYPNLFLCVVGPTGASRKTTSWYATERLLENVDSNWLKECVTSGLSTGEGVVYAVRDEKKNPTGKIIDQGVADKRRLFVETEFTRVLKQQLRQGNNLSDVLKEAWDGRDLSINTKNNPLRATGAHISLIGHITPKQLRENISDQDIAGGFANRFLWCWAETRETTETYLSSTPLGKLAFDISTNLRKISQGTQMQLSPDAKDLWKETRQRSLSKTLPGIIGDLLTRNAPQVLRVAMIYALLDGRYIILPEDLHAALAVVEYSRQTIYYIWQNTLGDPKADYMLNVLRNHQTSLTKAQIHSILQRQYQGHVVEQILKELTDLQILIPYKNKNNIVYEVNNETLHLPSILPPFDACCLSLIPEKVINYYAPEE